MRKRERGGQMLIAEWSFGTRGVWPGCGQAAQ